MAMPPHEQTQLMQAKALIQQKRYDEARAILEGLPFNKTAFEWLTKLDQIAPQAVPASPPPNSQARAELPPLPPKYSSPKSKPSGGVGKAIIIIGQVIVGVVALIVVIGLREGSLSDIIDDRFFGGSYEGQYLSISYSGKWDKWSSDWATYCKESDEECFLTLILPDNPSTHASAMVFDFDAMSDPNGYIKDLANDYWDDPGYEFVRQSYVTIAGIEALAIHDIYYHPEDPAYHTMRVYIPVKNGVLQVNCWSQDAAVQEARIEDYLKVLGTIEWTEGTI
jgi:hypothetical protein